MISFSYYMCMICVSDKVSRPYVLSAGQMFLRYIYIGRILWNLFRLLSVQKAKGPVLGVSWSFTTRGRFSYPTFLRWKKKQGGNSKNKNKTNPRLNWAWKGQNCLIVQTIVGVSQGLAGQVQGCSVSLTTPLQGLLPDYLQFIKSDGNLFIFKFILYFFFSNEYRDFSRNTMLTGYNK